jgi:hypothetical protein
MCSECHVFASDGFEGYPVLHLLLKHPLRELVSTEPPSRGNCFFFFFAFRSPQQDSVQLLVPRSVLIVPELAHLNGEQGLLVLYDGQNKNYNADEIEWKR